MISFCAEVMANTRVTCEDGVYTLQDGHRCELPKPSASYAWKATSHGSLPNFPQQKTTVTVSNYCSLTAARRARQSSKHCRVLVLNMANRMNPGGLGEFLGGFLRKHPMVSTCFHCLLHWHSKLPVSIQLKDSCAFNLFSLRQSRRLQEGK